MKLIDKEALIQYLTGMACSACCDENVERIIKKFIIPHINSLEVKEVDLGKDLKLTWEDVKKIIKIHTEIYLDFFINDNGCKVDTKEYYQEVLKRFKAQKKGKV